MRVDGVFVAGLGAYIPAVFDAARAVETGRYDPEQHRRGGWTGAAVAGDMAAPDLAVRAARQALDSCGHDPSEIDILFHATVLAQGPDGWSPQHYVQRHTIGGHAPAVEIRQACNGMLGGIELACSYLVAGDRTAALVTGGDNFGSPLVDRWRYADGGGTDRGSILGDAGTAVVLSRRGGFAKLLAVGSASLPEFEEMYRGDEPLFPPSCTVGRPMEIGRRFAEFAARRPDGLVAVMRRLRDARTELARRTIAEAGLVPADITRATHVFAGQMSYLRSVLGPVGIDPSRGMLEFGRRLGHMGVNDHIAGLTHLVEQREVGPGDHVMLLGNGSGMTLSCVVIEIITDRDQ